MAEEGEGSKIFGRTHALSESGRGVVESSVNEVVEDQFERRKEELDGGLEREKD